MPISGLDRPDQATGWPCILEQQVGGSQLADQVTGTCHRRDEVFVDRAVEHPVQSSASTNRLSLHTGRIEYLVWPDQALAVSRYESKKSWRKSRCWGSMRCKSAAGRVPGRDQPFRG